LTRECGRLGTASYEVTIVVEGATGRPRDVRAVSTPPSGLAMDGCVSEAFRRMTLPRFRARTQTLTRSFRVSPPLPDLPPDDALRAFVALAERIGPQCQRFGSGRRGVLVTWLGTTGAVDSISISRTLGPVVEGLVSCVTDALRSLPALPPFGLARFARAVLIDLGPPAAEPPPPGAVSGEDYRARAVPVVRRAVERSRRCTADGGGRFDILLTIDGATGRIQDLRLTARGSAMTTPLFAPCLRGAFGEEPFPTSSEPTRTLTIALQMSPGRVAAVDEPAGSDAEQPTPSTELDQPTREQVLNAVRAIAPVVAACGQGQHGPAPARMTVSGATGRVSEVSVSGPFAGTPVATCVASAVRGARFPPFRRPTFLVNFPFAVGAAEPGGSARTAPLATPAPVLPPPPSDETMRQALQACAQPCSGTRPFVGAVWAEVEGATGRIRAIRFDATGEEASVRACIEHNVSSVQLPRARSDYTTTRVQVFVPAREPQRFVYRGDDAAWLEVQNDFRVTQHVFIQSGNAAPQFLGTVARGATDCFAVPPGSWSVVSSDSANPTDNPARQELNLGAHGIRHWTVYRSGSPAPENRPPTAPCAHDLTADGTPATAPGAPPATPPEPDDGGDTLLTVLVVVVAGVLIGLGIYGATGG